MPATQTKLRTKRTKRVKLDTLPTVPSELILLALRDLQALLKTGKYQVNMSQWVTPNGKCSVCLAGAVMVREFDVKQETPDIWIQLEPHKNALFALNEFRTGNAQVGCRVLSRHTNLDWQTITPYNTNPRQFFRDMRQLAKDLAAEGN